MARHRDCVCQRARCVGVDTDIDLWHEHELGIDWTRWGQQRVEDSNHVLIAMNHAWAERWAGHNDPTEGAGAVMEADALHGLLATDQAAFQRKAIVVRLSGADGDIPPDLARLIRRRIQTVDEAQRERWLLLRVEGNPRRTAFRGEGWSARSRACEHDGSLPGEHPG